MAKITWNDATGRGDVATIYSSTDNEQYRGFYLSRGANNLISITKEGELVQGLEGLYTAYNLAKAAIDHQQLAQAARHNL
jgi:hypothetical protein